MSRPARLLIGIVLAAISTLILGLREGVNTGLVGGLFFGFLAALAFGLSGWLRQQLGTLDIRAMGGLIFGAVGDRIGRAKTLTLTVLMYFLM